jgi:hypothetical protein
MRVRQSHSPTRNTSGIDRFIATRLSSIKLDSVDEVVFFKRDELTTDLICCNLILNTKNGLQTWFFHEETSEWKELITWLNGLSGFDQDWFKKVMQPPFAESRTVAFRRQA